MAMIRIVDSTNRRAVTALLSPERTRDVATERRVAAIVSDVRRGGDRALVRYARELDGLPGPIEVSRDEMRRAAREVPAPVRAALRAAAPYVRHDRSDAPLCRHVTRPLRRKQRGYRAAIC